MANLLKSNWTCYCGRLNRIKFRQIICPICFTECHLRCKNISDANRFQEMAAKLWSFYYGYGDGEIGKKNLLHLLAHHFWLMKQLV
jgi:hypothetical protein